jgi:uncharacterized protein YdeI (YjbR/CyaY-like superfamily)
MFQAILNDQPIGGLFYTEAMASAYLQEMMNARQAGPATGRVEEIEAPELEDDADEDDSALLITDATDFEEAVAQLFRDSDDFEFPQVRRVDTYEEAGMMTTDRGVVVTLRNGKTFTLTIAER